MARDGEEHADIVPVHRPAVRRCLASRRRHADRASVSRKRSSAPRNRRSPILHRGPTLACAPTEIVEDGMPTIIDIRAEAAKLTMFHGLTPHTKRGERKGSAAQLPRYRDGLLLLGKSAGTSHWETHPEDELVHVLDGEATLDV